MLVYNERETKKLPSESDEVKNTSTIPPLDFNPNKMNRKKIKRGRKITNGKNGLSANQTIIHEKTLKKKKNGVKQKHLLT